MTAYNHLMTFILYGFIGLFYTLSQNQIISWGSFQSRYILAAIPFLLILGVKCFLEICEQTSRSNNVLIKLGITSFLYLLLFFIITKTYVINLQVSFPNDMAYF